MQPVALGGFMGTGKTTVGRKLAERLQFPFVDTDEVLVQRYGPIASQFAEWGEETFRAHEREVVLEHCDNKLRVLATGGGVWTSESLRWYLRESAYFCVVLTAPFEVDRKSVV